MALQKQFKHKTLFCRFLAPGTILVEKDDKTSLPGKGKEYFKYVEDLGENGWEIVDVEKVYSLTVDEKKHYFFITTLKMKLLTQTPAIEKGM